MEVAPYSNRELDEKFKDIMGALGRIEGQTTKTNGRVTAIEKWRWVLTGGFAVLTALVVPILGWSLLEIINFKETLHVQVQAAVQDALAQYNIIVK